MILILLNTCPYHFNLLSYTFLHISPALGVPLILSFHILSNLLTPNINLNILISTTSNFFSRLSFVRWTCFGTYTIPGVTTVLKCFPLTLKLILGYMTPCSMEGMQHIAQWWVWNTLLHGRYETPCSKEGKKHHARSLRAGYNTPCIMGAFSPQIEFQIVPTLPFPSLTAAPSIETFKSRLIEAISTGAIVVAPPRTVTTIHAGVGARGQPLRAFWDGRCLGIYGEKKKKKIVCK